MFRANQMSTVPGVQEEGRISHAELRPRYFPRRWLNVPPSDRLRRTFWRTRAFCGRLVLLGTFRATVRQHSPRASISVVLPNPLVTRSYSIPQGRFPVFLRRAAPAPHKSPLAIGSLKAQGTNPHLGLFGPLPTRRSSRPPRTDPPEPVVAPPAAVAPQPHRGAQPHSQPLPAAAHDVTAPAHGAELRMR